MRLGIDTNVLVYAHLPAFPQHMQARSFLTAKLAQPKTALVLTPMILHEFVHVITDPRRFEPPVSMQEAIALARGYCGRANAFCVDVPEAAFVEALTLLEHHQLGRKRIADTLLVAALRHHGVGTLVTYNDADFAVFEDLRVIAPS